MNQKQKILLILQDKNWHCVNEFIDTYCVDYRRRLKDLDEDGYILTSRKCEQHNHRGGSKEWYLISEPSDRKISMQEVISHSELKQSVLL